MVRRVASQVHKQYARLARSGYFNNQAKEPAWYKAVLDHPPIPLPPRSTPTRSAYDLPAQRTDHFKQLSKAPKNKTPPIVYIEDEVRRQFFRDHPFEVFRERTLVESGRIEDEHPVQGPAWIRLSQRGRNPSPEDAVRFAVSLHKHHDMELSDAYAASVTQFRALRSEHHIATQVAVAEAEAYGAEYGPSEIERGFLQEEKHLESWEKGKTLSNESLEARKRWKAIIEKKGNVGAWTRGEEYVRLWKEGIRPNYILSVTSDPVTESVETQKMGDFMDLRSHMQAGVATEADEADDVPEVEEDIIEAPVTSTNV